jgi:SPP1 family predicted phage head-tail adaptor
MKQILNIEERTVGNELAGEPAETWVVTRREWFDLQPLTGSEYVQAQQVQANISHKATSPFLIGVSTKMRLTVKNEAGVNVRTFNVESVVNVGENNRELEWMLREVV